MNGYWVVRTYEAGAVGEKTKFWVPGERPSKSGRREKQELRKQQSAMRWERSKVPMHWWLHRHVK